MLDHIRHLISSAAYNKGTLANPGRLSALAGAWYRNEVAYLRRTSRLLGVEAREMHDALRESGDALEYCVAELRRYSAVFPGLTNPNYGPVLYALVRLLKPEVVVETGVGSGASSTFFLSAMERNGVGSLHSIDLPLPNERLLPRERRTGWLVPDRLRGRWELILGDVKNKLPGLLNRLGTVGFFYHDSDHSYANMTWEYSSAYPNIQPGGLLLSDDITEHRAWDDFTSGVAGRRTRINRLGVIRKPAD